MISNAKELAIIKRMVTKKYKKFGSKRNRRQVLSLQSELVARRGEPSKRDKRQLNTSIRQLIG